MHDRKGIGWIIVGILLIMVAFSLTAFNRSEAEKAGENAAQEAEILTDMIPPTTKRNDLTEEEDVPDYILNPDMEMPTEIIDGQEYIGILKIPSLELELPVINEWSYPGLRIAPCRYAGTAYKGNFIIAAHNYTSHFGKLKNLRMRDAITFIDIDGNEFNYEVADIEILAPTAVEDMENGDWDLTLFTCTVGGQSRVTVRCEKKAK